VTGAAVRTAFFSVADQRYFLGAVALVNSLRLMGHNEEIHVLDCGFTDRQRDLLAPEVTLVDGPEAPPWLLKTVAPLDHPAEVSVLLDSDMIVTSPLTDLISKASEGRVVAFRDRQDRFVPEWGELLGLGVARRTSYVSSGLVILGGELRERVLHLLEAAQSHVDFDLTFWRRNVREYPFLYADQDVLNAILATSVEPERVVALDNRLAPNPPFRGLRLTDAATLRCRYRDGAEPFLIHQYVRKPWLEPTYHSVYSRLLARLLNSADVAVTVPQSEIPRRLRAGRRAHVERVLTSAKDFPRWRFGDLLPGPIGTRIDALRRRRAARSSDAATARRPHK
jgi:hypothetical protein